MKRERRREKERGKQRRMEKRGKTHPLYCISDFVTRVSSAAIPDRYSLSFNDRVYICMYTYICKRVAWKSVIYGANVHPRNVLSRTYPREKRQTAKCTAGLLNFRGMRLLRADTAFYLFFFYRWNEFLESSNSERSFRIHIRRGYKRDSRKGTGWNWLERKFVLISCWMIVICFFLRNEKGVQEISRIFVSFFF